MTKQHPERENDFPRSHSEVVAHVFGENYPEFTNVKWNKDSGKLWEERCPLPQYMFLFDFLGTSETSQRWHAQEQKKTACKDLPSLDVKVIWL